MQLQEQSRVQHLHLKVMNNFMFVIEIRIIDNKKRKVYLDNGYTFPLYNSEIRKFKIIENSELDENTFSEIHSLLISRAGNRILYLLGDCDKSTASVRIKLKSGGYPDDVIECAIDTLTEYGYLNDERYTRNYIESMRDYKGKSRREIVSKLYQKGIASELIERVISEYEFDEYSLVIKALDKKNVDISEIGLMDNITRNNLYAYLMRKGFSADVCNRLFHNDFV